MWKPPPAKGERHLSTRSKLVLALAWLAIMSGLLWWMLSPDRLSDEEQIRAALERAERGVEQGKAGDVLAVVSANYNDSHGFTRNDIRDGLIYAFRHDASFDVVVDVRSIMVSGDRAWARIHVQVTAVFGRSVPSTYETDASLTFAREGRRWRCTNAEGWHDVASGIAAEGGL